MHVKAFNLCHWEFVIQQIFIVCPPCPPTLSRHSGWGRTDKCLPLRNRVEDKVRLTHMQAPKRALRPVMMVISKGSTQSTQVRIKCICRWQKIQINSGLKTQILFYQEWQVLIRADVMFREVIQDPGSIRLSTPSSLPRLWPPFTWSKVAARAPAVKYSRRKGRRRVCFLPFKEGWEIQFLFQVVMCTPKNWKKHS